MVCYNGGMDEEHTVTRSTDCRTGQGGNRAKNSSEADTQQQQQQEHYSTTEDCLLRASHTPCGKYM